MGLPGCRQREHDLPPDGRADLTLPRTAVAVHTVESLPRLAAGKLDYPAIRRLAVSDPAAAPTVSDAPATEGPANFKAHPRRGPGMSLDRAL
jgi:hypothetical protein